MEALSESRITIRNLLESQVEVRRMRERERERETGARDLWSVSANDNPVKVRALPLHAAAQGKFNGKPIDKPEAIIPLE